MNSSLAALQAKQALESINRLRNEVLEFAAHARTLNSVAGNFDSRSLLDEATRLLKKLGDAQLSFLGPNGKIDSLARAFPARPPSAGGMSPAAQWVPQLRAASRQFAEAARSAETAVLQLRGTALDELKRPTRTPTGDPSDGWDILMSFTDLLGRWIDHYNKTDHR